ncbi:MAG: sirohydrochlorin cobaltochelatase [Desulfobacterales bacterium]|nr:sirohydrochlorin cobaltochelatase [Desulfobacterales bacterium]MBS3754886.1 sirohydrochlorin cobaltochelatase [Desulfobacterales bacterium]
MKITRSAIFLIGIALLIIAAAPLQAEGKKQDKTGILLVTFGTTFPEARAAFKNIKESASRAFPDTPVKWAYTSEMIRKKMADKGKQADSPDRALEKMDSEGFSRVAVQSLHTIAGHEFHDLVKTVRKFENNADSIKEISISGPLLDGPESMEKAAHAIRKSVPAERKPGEAVVLLGHGTHHPSNSAYAALMWRLQTEDENMFIGTVEGYPGPETIIEQLGQNKVSSAWLMPFMSVAGDHARNDMAGDGKDSWKTLLSEAGLASRPVMKGFAEYEPFVDIWIDQLKEAIENKIKVKD